ncbi:hypothetical protein CCH79_00015126 [Gambusia affinis]|uniref:Iodothyronine deiodinase n=1 Tax=Gambusia affinis TaxID=33528 RepID=A0A315VHW2_GAMAF|nr:hypothetical protein CCH79_00015126 [Gambusia affinis]
MARLKAFQEVAQLNADIADIVVVYIEEAHPSDGWTTTDAPYQIPKHRSLEERLSAAHLIHMEVPGCRVVADNMEDSSSAAYGAYFNRLYVLQRGTVAFQGGRGPEGYRISELRAWLDRHRKALQKTESSLALNVSPSDLGLRPIWNRFQAETLSIYVELTADRGVPAWMKDGLRP